MGILDRFLGGGASRPDTPNTAGATDDQAIARYRYLLRTAPPEAIEQAHAEAFAQLTPEQRRRVLEDLREGMSAAERNAAIGADETPGALARVATRAELRQPGTMERTFGGLGAIGAGGTGFGGLLAGSFLSSMAGTVLGTMIAHQFFSSHPEASQLFGNNPAAAGNDTLASNNGGDTLDGSTAGLVRDPFDRTDSATSDADSDLGSAFGSGDDLAGFDGGDNFDI